MCGHREAVCDRAMLLIACTLQSTGPAPAAAWLACMPICLFLDKSHPHLPMPWSPRLTYGQLADLLCVPCVPVMVVAQAQVLCGSVLGSSWALPTCASWPGAWRPTPLVRMPVRPAHGPDQSLAWGPLTITTLLDIAHSGTCAPRRCSATRGC